MCQNPNWHNGLPQGHICPYNTEVIKGGPLMTQSEVEKHLADPYNRIRYAYEFLDSEIGDFAKCIDRIYYWLSKDIDCEVHY